ncbi:hypothetical protein GCM10009850_113170 [Nonomuraea monospora]|uniref:Transposase n=1 Tax=Nonomuraea monospora TaxID=568818 RepID=A0ABP5PW27_9ACTN
MNLGVRVREAKLVLRGLDPVGETVVTRTLLTRIASQTQQRADEIVEQTLVQTVGPSPCGSRTQVDGRMPVAALDSTLCDFGQQKGFPDSRGATDAKYAYVRFRGEHGQPDSDLPVTSDKGMPPHRVTTAIP